ncbi:hypothetical protein H0H92_013610, partial [Tricholoma furcatifolium]
MSKQFDELRLCEGHWKAQQIATDHYPSWHKNYAEKLAFSDGADEGGTSGAPRTARAVPPEAHQATLASANGDEDFTTELAQVGSESDDGDNVDLAQTKRLFSTEAIRPPTKKKKHAILARQVRPAATPMRRSASATLDQVETSLIRAPLINIIPGTPAAPSTRQCSLEPRLLQPSAPQAHNFLASSLIFHFRWYVLLTASLESLQITNPLTNVQNPGNPSAESLPLAVSRPPWLPTAAPAQEAALLPLPPLHPPAKLGSSVLRPNPKSTTPRNLCAFEWKKTNPKGTTAEYSAYWDNLPDVEKE